MKQNLDGGPSPDLVNLEDTFRGFYRSTEDDWRDVLTGGLVVLDTNALLDLYRLSPSGRTELFAVLDALRDRLFVPHQVACEFHERRLDAVADRVDEINKAAATLEEQRHKARGLLRQVSRRAHAGDAAAEDVQQLFTRAFDSAAEFIESVSSEYDLSPESMLSRTDDPVLARLESLLAGRVGPRPSFDVLETDMKEGKRRADAELPPGFKDAAKKTENQFGDYLWWAETVRYATEHPTDVLLVCNDVAKGDWTYEKRGIRVGPATALVDEMAAATSCRLLLCTTAELLGRAASHLSVAVSDNTVSETRNLPPQPDAVFDVGSERNLVPIGWLRALIRMDPHKLQPWFEAGYLQSLDDVVWHWEFVRKAAVIAEALRSEIDPALIPEVIASLDARPSGHTRLVLLDEGQHVWLRHHDLSNFLQDLETEPRLVYNLQPLERDLRRTQAGLLRQVVEDDDS